MNVRQENVTNNPSYHRLKKSIDEQHPHGWFVAIADDQIVAAAPDFHAMEAMLHTQGKDPRTVLVVQAGVAYPDYVTIFV